MCSHLYQTIFVNIQTIQLLITHSLIQPILQFNNNLLSLSDRSKLATRHFIPLYIGLRLVSIFNA